MSSREYLRIHTFDQRVVTRVSVGTQTDWRDEEDGSRGTVSKHFNANNESLTSVGKSIRMSEIMSFSSSFFHSQTVNTQSKKHHRLLTRISS